MMTPRETPEKVMTRSKFSFNQDLNPETVTCLICGFILNLPGSGRFNENRNFLDRFFKRFFDRFLEDFVTDTLEEFWTDFLTDFSERFFRQIF